MDKLAKEKREATAARVERGEVEMANTTDARREPLDSQSKHSTMMHGVLMRHSVSSVRSFEPPPSLLPAKKYCDVTGLEVRPQSQSIYVTWTDLDNRCTRRLIWIHRRRSNSTMRKFTN